MKKPIVLVITSATLALLFVSSVSAFPMMANTNLMPFAPISELDDDQKGDMNNDGRIDAFDIEWFAMVYTYAWFFQIYHPELFWRADIDNNGVLDQHDIELFVQLLTQ